jgi:hypothetical protein
MSRHRKIQVLVFAQSKTHLNELSRAARVLDASGNCKTTVLSQTDAVHGRRQLRLHWSRRFRTILVQSLFRALRLKGIAIADLELCWANDHALLENANDLLDWTRPDVVLVGEDGLGGPLHLIGIARDRGLPVIVIPYEYSTRVQIIRHIHDYGLDTHRLSDGTSSKILSRFMPQWILETDDGLTTRLPPPLAVSLFLHGIAPAQPWTVHGGRASKIAVESSVMFAHYLREGVPRHKLALTGSPANDELRVAMHSDPVSQLAFDRGVKRAKGQTVILCALPPSYLPDRAQHSDFSTFADLALFWIDTLVAQRSATVAFQLHPAMRSADAAMVRERVNVTSANIVELVPHVDVLVTSVSSIIRFAIACRKPVINYDVYGFKNPEYIGAPGVINIDRAIDFASAIERIVSDEQYYTQLTASQLQNGADWGSLDGMAAERLMALVKDLV